MKAKTAILLTLLLFSFGSYAQRLLGSQVDYHRLDTAHKYEVRLLVYADCRYASFQLDSHAVFSIKGNSSAVDTLHSKLQGVKNISNYHDSISSCGSGDSILGILQYTYLDTVDFNAAYSGLMNQTVRFQFQATGRMQGSTNCGSLSVNRNTYNWAEVKPWLNPEGGFFNTEAVFLYYKNTGIYTNFMVSSNNDSVSFGLMHPHTSSTSQVSCAWNGDPIFPDAYLCPGSNPGSCNNPNANPPIGVHFDPEWGMLIYTPLEDSTYDNFVVESTIWTMDSTGTRVNAGKVRTEQFHIIGDFGDNYPPRLNGPFGYAFCEQSTLSYNVTTSDQAFIYPPGGPSAVYDTLNVSWDGFQESNGVKFTITDSSARLKTAKIEWPDTFPNYDKRDHFITLVANDQHGPVNVISKQVFRSFVKPKASGSLTNAPLYCGSSKQVGLELSLVADSNVVGTPSYRMELLDTSGNLMVSDRLYFNSTGSFLSAHSNDSLFGDTTGLFVIKSTINNSPYNCPSVFYDTISIDVATPLQPSFLPDSVYCNVNFARLTVPGNWESIVWSTGDTVAQIDVTQSGTYQVELTDSCLNKYSYSAEIVLRQTPIDIFDDEYKICEDDTLKLAYSNLSEYAYNWSNGDTTYSSSFTDSGSYFMTVSNSCGAITDSFSIDFLPEPLAKMILDSSICDWIYCNYQQYDTIEQQFVWYINKTAYYDSFFIALTELPVTLIAYNQCGADSVFEILKPIPSPWVSIDSLPDYVCEGDTVSVTANGNFLADLKWSNGDSAISTRYHSVNQITVMASNSCGSAYDTISIDWRTVPTAKLRGDTTLCDGDSIVLKPLLPQIDATAWWKDALPDSQQVVKTGGEFVLTYFNECGLTRDSVNIELKTIPVAMLVDDTTLCLGDTITLRPLQAQADATARWNGTTTANELEVVEGGEYILAYTNQCGSTTDTVIIEENDIPIIDLGNDIIVDLPDQIELSVDSSYAYVWNTGETSHKIVVSDTGMYWVEATNVCGTVSDTIFISDTSAVINNVKELAHGISLYPNPAKNKIVVYSDRIIDRISIYNSFGQFVFEEEIGANQMALNLTNYGAGNYMLVIVIGQQRAVRKLVIVK